MTDPPVDHEAIEEAFAPAQQIIDRLPEGFARERATDNLKVAEQYVHQFREKIRPAPEGD